MAKEFTSGKGGRLDVQTRRPLQWDGEAPIARLVGVEDGKAKPGLRNSCVLKTGRQNPNRKTRGR